MKETFDREMVTDMQRNGDREKWWSMHDKDVYVCPDCGRTQAEHGRVWEVHHIDNIPGKIVGLCKSCHYIRHGGDPKSVDLEFWKEGMQSLGT